MPTRCTNRRTKQSLPLTKPQSARNPCDLVFQQRQGGSRIHPLLLPGVKAKPAQDSISTHRSCTGPVRFPAPLSGSSQPPTTLPLGYLYLWGIGWLQGRLHSCAHNHTKTNTHIIKNNKEKSLQKDMEKISCTLKWKKSSLLVYTRWSLWTQLWGVVKSSRSP